MHYRPTLCEMLDISVCDVRARDCLRSRGARRRRRKRLLPDCLLGALCLLFLEAALSPVADPGKYRQEQAWAYQSKMSNENKTQLKKVKGKEAYSC